MARKNRQTAAARGASPAAPATALGKARWMLEAGDVRRAREYARQAASAGTEAEQAEGRALLELLKPDRAALLVIGGVLLLIVLAAWLAILRTH